MENGSIGQIDNPLKFTKRVSFELSNICNNSSIHAKCPLSLKHEINILPKKVIISVLEVLKKYNFSGMISFHNYNEPGIDPRLMSLVELTKDYCPDCFIYFSTNGFYLDQNLIEEYEEAGVDKMHISAYSDSEYKRLSKLKTRKMALSIEHMFFDDRLAFYDSPEKKCDKPCYAPLNELIINNNADIVLCCWDWKYKYKYGNLKYQGLEEILTSKKISDVYNKLSRGIRHLDICKSCNQTR